MPVLNSTGFLNKMIKFKKLGLEKVAVLHHEKNTNVQTAYYYTSLSFIIHEVT